MCGLLRQDLSFGHDATQTTILISIGRIVIFLFLKIENYCGVH